MSSLHFVVSIGEGDQLNDRIREVADKINKHGTQTFPALHSLKVPVKQVVVGNSYLGVLLADGRAFRVAYSVIAERLDLSKHDSSSKNNGSGAGNGSSNAGNNSGNSGSSTSKTAQASSRQLARSTRARIMRTSGSSVRGQTSRSTGVIIGGTTSGRSLVTVPATFVPEELISQAQVVLQGKSRNLIIRELQRTNLDVNLAVNNLLSRDDEEGEDTEEGSDNYVPEDLISLLDSGIHPDPSLLLDNDAMFSEDMRTFRNLMLSSRDRMQSSSAPSANQNESSNLRTSGTSSVSAVVSGTSSGTSTSLTFGRLRDRTYFGPRRWFQSSREEVQWEKEQETRNKLDTSSGFPLWISDDLEYWPEKDGTRFTSIAALHSEFIALSSKGELHQWRWADREPYRNNEQPNIHHPKTLTLGLTFEKISHVSATTIRCSAVTESGKIATWMDEQLGYAGNKLEHSATSYPEFTLDKITSLHTCSLYTVARTESGELFWWGVLPFSQRKKMWEKYKAKSKKPQKKDKDKDATLNEVTVGAQVCMKNSPMYQPGAIGFCISNGVPKVGQLMNAAWDLMNICRFKILPMPPLSNTSTSSSGSTNVTSEPKEPMGKTSSQVTNTNSNSCGSTSSVGNKETTDRLDMPPPPSPASSTCSDTSVSVKRKRVTQKDDSDNKKDEEFWNLKDVVFVEDIRSVPVGKVLKVDGQFAAVRFPSNSKDKFDESSTDAWQDCRLLRKDDLQIIKSTATSRVPDCIQKIPRRVVLNLQLNEHSQLLTLTIDSKGIHTIMKTGSALHYSLFNLSGGRMGKSSNFPTDLNSFMGKSPQNISLMCAGDQPESILILRDGNKTIYPLAKDCLEAIRDPLWMDLPPLSCIAATPVTIQSTNVNKTQVTLVVLATEQQLLMPKIMRCDVDAVKFYLQQLNNELKSQVSSVVQEFADGNRNILHACVTQCSPTSNKDSDQELTTTPSNTGSGSGTGPNIVLECINAVANSMISSRPSSNIRDLMRRSSSTSALTGESHHMSTSGVSVSSADDNSINLSYWPGEYDGGNSGDEDSLSGLHMQKSQTQNQSAEVYVSDPTERRLNALLSVQMMCENAALQPHLRQLLSAKDSTGQTPFMLANSSRSYQAGIVIFDAILKIANGDAAIRDSMVFPNGCGPDQSPLHVICCNDTCSFTWTGADHINQDIFECQTCGLSGSLCCCTECAKVCHKGHDCKLKQTTPTAYCDCWQKCKCKALIAGNQTKRAELLEKLIKDTDLVTKFNSRGESILLFLIQTVGRQSIEQRQYRSARGQQRSSTGSYLNRKTPSIDAEGDMPEHDLEPPRFARKALERLLGDWNAVRGMIQTGVESEINLNSMASQVFYEDSDSKSLYINSQSGTIMLDKFTHILFFRCNNEPLDALLTTLIKELQNEAVPGRTDEAQKVARRFVRSVARVFVIFSIEKSNNPDKQRNSTLQARLMLAYRRVFTSLLKFAIEELVEIADSLIAPVRLGVVRPTAPFQLSSSTNNLDADDLFSVEPLAPASRHSSMQDAVTSQIDTEPSEGGFLARISSALRNDLDDTNDPDAMVHDDGDVSEQDDSQSVIHSRQNISNNNNNNVVDDAVDDQIGPDGGHEAESDNEFNFQEAETESDSDDNQSTQDAGRSVQTGATAGSDTGLSNFVLINEDDTGDSSQPDEDGSEDGDSDEQSTEEFVLDEQLERRTTTSGTQRSTAPHSLHWAIRSRETTRATNLHRLAGASNLVFIDPSAIRRSASSNAVAAQESPTMATTSSALARAFGIVLRQISELVGMLAWKFACPTSNNYQNYDMTYQEAVQLQMSVERRLKPTWDWILTVMDATEAQLRFGASLTDSTDSAHPLHPSNIAPATTSTSNVGPPLQRPNRTVTIQMLTPNLNTFNSSRARDRTNGVDNATSRRDFLTYCLSLMRAHNSEHRDSLPVLDVTALRHVAYVLDAIIFYMRASNDLDCDRNDTNAWDDQDDNENDDVDDEFTTSLVMDTDSIDDSDMVRPSLGKRHGFFQRSESTLCLGCPAPDSFNTPMAEALPLADQPQLLQPNARREDLFGMPKHAITMPTGEQASSTLELPPIRLGLSSISKGETSQTSNRTNTVVISVTPSATESKNEPSVGGTHKHLSRSTISKTVVSIVGKETETVSLKRPHSPQPGPSNVQKHFEEYEDEDESGDDEPQDLSQQAGHSNTSSKMDIDDTTSSSIQAQKSERNLYEDSDDSDNDAESTLMRSPAHKKHRLMDLEQSEDFSLVPSVSKTPEDQQSEDIDPSTNRPPIIVVTRRNVADAIEAVTATVLSKNKKTTLSQCVAPETPLSFLPNNFGDGEGPAATKSSVIVRVGPSTSSQIEPSLETMDENQEVSANVTIETTNTPGPSQMVQELPPRGVYFRSNVNSDLLLGRWRLSLILFGRVFQEDVGMEPGSIISELGGFPVKEAKFRRHMEKLRNGQQRDLTLSKIDRARSCLIPQTFKELNTQYNNNNRRLQPPLAFNRVKVTFKDEPGEGSGVARSFYTLIAEALLSRENLPNLESAQVGSSKYNVPFSTMIRQRNVPGGNQGSSVAIANSPSSLPPRELSEPIRRLTTKRTLWRNRDNRKVMLNFDSRPFRPQSEGGSNEHLSGHQQQLGERLYNKVYQIHPSQASKITGMLLDLPPTQWIMLLSSDETLRQKANEAMALITFRHRTDRDGSTSGTNNNNQQPSASVSLNISSSATLNIISSDALPNSQQQCSTSQPPPKKLNPIVVLEDCQIDDNAPLFYQPGKPNVYSPRQGYPSFERINAFRNVGRLVGLCLLQNELLPIFLQRHVLKYILGRQIRFHDLAFFDPIVYESLRQLVKDSQSKNGAQLLQSLELNFVIDLGPEEGGGSVELVHNGRDIIVNEQNVYDYVRKYAEYRMIKTQEKALEALRLGVFDVLPETALDSASLTAEDLRLLLNGVGDINVSVLSNYTSFNDESNESAEKLQRFKKWLWQIVERMTNIERQDLIYFWTGSPALPASEEGFQPMPTVTIRPADDAHLPTANTCISRLYIPLYSSKAVLRHKLLMAIKTKNFGFV